MILRKIFIIITNVIILCLMIALLVLTIVGFTRYRQINSLVGNYFTIAFGVVLGIIILAGLISICGMCLFSSTNCCCCICYSILAIIMGVIFLGLGIASFIAIPYAIGDNCTSNSFFQQFQGYAERAQKSICFICECYLPQEILLSTYTPQQLVDLIPKIPLVNHLDSSLPVKAQDCQTWSGISNRINLNAFNFLQTHFKCTGWCQNTTSLFFRFSNISNGIPQKTCYSSVHDTTNHLKNIIGIPSIIIGSLFFISILAFCFICCITPQLIDKKQTHISYPSVQHLTNFYSNQRDTTYYNPISPFPLQLQHSGNTSPYNITHY